MLPDTVKSNPYKETALKILKEEFKGRGVNVSKIEVNEDLRSMLYRVRVTVQCGSEQFTMVVDTYFDFMDSIFKGDNEPRRTFINNFVKRYEQELERLADIELFEAEPEHEPNEWRI